MANRTAVEHFPGRVLGYARWRSFLGQPGGEPESLAAFHRRERRLLPSHDPRPLADMEALAAAASNGDANRLDRYAAQYHASLNKRATTARHAAVLPRWSRLPG